jgi:hypothetical protein
MAVVSWSTRTKWRASCKCRARRRAPQNPLSFAVHSECLSLLANLAFLIDEHDPFILFFDSRASKAELQLRAILVISHQNLHHHLLTKTNLSMGSCLSNSLGAQHPLMVLSRIHSVATMCSPFTSKVPRACGVRTSLLLSGKWGTLANASGTWRA